MSTGQVESQPIDKIIFSVTEDELQFEAERIIGRRLTDDELAYASKGIEWGLGTGIGIVFDTAIKQSVILAG
jgi:hypothetical protein